MVKVARDMFIGGLLSICSGYSLANGNSLNLDSNIYLKEDSYTQVSFNGKKYDVDSRDKLAVGLGELLELVDPIIPPTSWKISRDFSVGFTIKEDALIKERDNVSRPNLYLIIFSSGGRGSYSNSSSGLNF